MPAPSDRFSLANPDVVACPWPHYRRLQHEAPVFHDPVTGLYEVTGHDLIREIAAQPQLYSNKSNRQASRSPDIVAAMMDLYGREGFMPAHSLLNNDPPDHRAVRSLVDKAFMPARINALKPAILAEVTELIDAANRKGEIEFVSEFAISLPLNIIADQLGVPRDERETIKRGSDALIAVADPLTPDDMMLEMTRRVVTMQQLLARRVAYARSHPDDTILSIVANGELNGEPVPMPLLIHLFQSILVAGNETTTNALGNGLVMLIDRPELFAELAAKPDRVKPFVEESLRLLSPLQGFYRVATADGELAGVFIPKGAMLMLRWGAANHDETVFACPERLDLDRDNLAKHTAFGSGIHFCLGNLLARTELHTAFGEITRSWRNVRIVGGRAAAEPAHQFFNQGMARLPVTFDSVQ
ncbi:MAG: cytochrome P450 [Novosphingobium sp.]|nr:cytochrome P450 [Novosphingobium sp.]